MVCCRYVHRVVYYLSRFEYLRLGVYKWALHQMQIKPMEILERIEVYWNKRFRRPIHAVSFIR